MKTLLALMIAYSASQVAYDRAFEHKSVAHHSPHVELCQFKPVNFYGQTLKLRGYFETGKCRILTKS